MSIEVCKSSNMAYRNIEDGRKYQREYYNKHRDSINEKKRAKRKLNVKPKQIITQNEWLKVSWI